MESRERVVTAQARVPTVGELIMATSAGNDLRFCYLVQPEFHKHAHIHGSKVRTLRNSGVQAEVCTVVSLRQIARQPHAYGAAAARSKVRVLRVPHGALSRWRTSLHLARLLTEGDLTVQVLRSPWPHTGWLRAYARRRQRRLRCLLELEGDPEAEADYLEDHPFQAGFYAPTIAANRRMAARLVREVADADGLVLMSEPHIRLWESRLRCPLRAIALPALFDPELMRFDGGERERLRVSLGVSGQVVLAYCGNVKWSWQRFASVCRIAAFLRGSGLPICLFALVHAVEHPMAKGFIERFSIEDCTRLLSCDAGQVHAFLSAADIGLFLRDDHLMNRIVTSAKLGEYLACGLPVITTGNAALYHDFIRSERMGLFLHQDDELPVNRLPELTELVRRARQGGWREAVSRRARERFAFAGDRERRYVEFVKGP